ncbi:MAG TPA: polyphosphate polymerase domain-containing protein [Bacteroides sp.]|nr:polyphosphate polymerase domain-containing protein [Bacteroides sp.]
MGNEYKEIIESVQEFSPITLEEMDNVQLMNRTDTKYIFPSVMLPVLLTRASGLYRVLTIKEKRIFRYNSLYFDTPGLKTYFEHHNGIRPRYKVRFREYEDTGTIFLEVKRKVSNDRTRKSRTKVDKIEHKLSVESGNYIEKQSPLNPEELSPALWTLFRRITLVSVSSLERITIDYEISFRHNEEEKALPFLCIAEVKRDKSNGSTEFMKILKAAHIYPGSSSKYCLGTILLKSPIKYNRFKENILKINKIEYVY